ncbi:F-box domain-containing protein [Mycena sanguinolenta]|uniref:F-box domain-containing protein n=1 Tax=Mycena sanguinolenta TaxID=230812 RepID=A0A8H6ZDD3_9AGAR|nr:F-box domain-containing protein [Mycena sanguinolenta]
MDTPAANRIPDEIVSEILTPLLKHSDEVFRDQSAKPLLDPDHSASRYLLVCKSWLRVSTPLLYNVVILRTTAQAEALQAVLKTNKEFGLFIKKLRAEGGFGDTMDVILKRSPNITDLYLTLYIAGSDNVKGLCSGLPFVNPRRVIVVDACSLEIQPKKNKKVTELLETLVSSIPKWDKMQIFQFPYLTDGGRDATRDLRAAALISALAKSPSLETLIVGMGYYFPEYLRELVDVPSLKSINFTAFPHLWNSFTWSSSHIHEAVERDAKLKALVSFHDPKVNSVIVFLSRDAEQAQIEKSRPIIHNAGEDRDAIGFLLSERHITLPSFLKGSRFFRDVTPDEFGNYFCPKRSLAYADSLQELETLGETVGGSVEQLHVSAQVGSANIDLTPFTSLVYLNWSGKANQYSLSATLPQLEQLSIGGATPFLLHIKGLPLNALRTVELSAHSPEIIAFLRCHGGKLQRLAAPPKTIIEADVFNLCPSLNTLTVSAMYEQLGEDAVIPQNVLACSTPHTSLAKIRFERCVITRTYGIVKARKDVTAAMPVFEQLNPEKFPGLKEIQINDIKWPTSEQQARKDPWITLCEMMHQKGIKVTDGAGVSGPTGARAKGSARRR